ncbi:MAG: ABC transporter, partial [Betaproteobacteria bacterium]|nr:ABC transporter [Betaproteobacteria bacterium]
MGGQALAVLHTDLDDRLRYAPGCVCVTREQLLARAPGETTWSSWPLRADLRLQRRDHAGVASLELLDSQGRVALWRHTLAQQDEATRLVAVFERQTALRSIASNPDLNSGAWSQADVDSTADGSDDSLSDARGTDDPQEAGDEAQTPPSTWSLLRLGRFARPYRSELALGLLLTLATTAATMVPPYLTMPLMDEVLIPYQNGRPIDPVQVRGYLAGLLVA